MCQQFGADLVRLERNLGARAPATPAQKHVSAVPLFRGRRRQSRQRPRGPFTASRAVPGPRTRRLRPRCEAARLERPRPVRTALLSLDMGPRPPLWFGWTGQLLPTACLMVRRDAFGVGFDEELRLGEDVDFIWRLWDHDWLVRYSPTWKSRIDTRELAALVEPTRALRGSSSELARRHGSDSPRCALTPGTSSPGSAHSSVCPGRCANRPGRARPTRGEVHRTSRRTQGPRQRHRRSTMVRTGGPLSRAVVPLTVSYCSVRRCTPTAPTRVDTFRHWHRLALAPSAPAPGGRTARARRRRRVRRRCFPGRVPYALAPGPEAAHHHVIDHLRDVLGVAQLRPTSSKE